MWLPVRRLFRLLLAGQPVPGHVAFIMDGNRRFADQAGVELLEGHTSGYSKMVDVIQWCFELGVPVVSVYAFSIDNFRRGAAEVEGLMRLAADKFDALMQDEAARQWGAELRVLGDLSLAPPGVQAAAARLMRSSAALRDAAPPGAPRRLVNVCFSYTSSEELGAALGRLRGGLAAWQLLPADVDAGLVAAALHTGGPRGGGSPPVDLVVRTSGEERLSDFLLWQSGGALLQWLPVLWPQLGFLDVLRALRAWQVVRPALRALAAAAEEGRARCGGGGALGDEARWCCSGGAVAGAGAAACCGGGGSGSGACACACACDRGGGAPSAAAPPAAAAAGGAPALLAAGDRAASASLSAIDEDGPSCAPHPSQQLRVDDFLRHLEAQRQAWIAATLDAAAAHAPGPPGRGAELAAPAS
ncbi:MAG: Decaprenyl diphosphate synthase-like protein [Monoraphidium minutum]|nr:MAG: Decaprenyl diphosphate synthase-like protein [Monoraphidium minutum]